MLLLFCSSRLDLVAGSDALVVVVVLLSGTSAAWMLALGWVFHGLTLSGRCYRVTS